MVNPTYCNHTHKLGLRNDHKALMKEIEKQLYSIHAEAKEKGTVAVQVQPDPSEVQPKTFACVTMVTNGSPAHNAVKW